MDWFLYDNGLSHERVKHVLKKTCSSVWKTAFDNLNSTSNGYKVTPSGCTLAL